MVGLIFSYPLLSPLFTLFPDLAASPNPPAKPKSTAIASEASLEKQIRRCKLFGSKPTAVQFCISDAKRWHSYREKHPEPPRKPMTPLEKEKSRCEMLGKPAVVQACKMDAPRTLRLREKAAEERAAAEAADKRTPLQKALDRCRNVGGKPVQEFQCRRDVKKRFSKD